MELLIKNGANVDVNTSSRKNRTSTLLHWTASQGFRQGYTFNIFSSNFFFPRKSNFNWTFSLILDNTEIKQKVADVLIAHGANVNAIGYGGKTPLMVAIEHSKLLKNTWIIL